MTEETSTTLTANDNDSKKNNSSASEQSNSVVNNILSMLSAVLNRLKTAGLRFEITNDDAKESVNIRIVGVRIERTPTGAKLVVRVPVLPMQLLPYSEEG